MVFVTNLQGFKNCFDQIHFQIDLNVLKCPIWYYYIAGCRYLLCAKTNTTSFEVRCHLDKGCTGKQWLAVVNYGSSTDIIFTTCWYTYGSKKARTSLCSATQTLVSVCFLCSSPIRYNLLPNSAVFIASVLLSGPLDHVKNCLIMCSNYRNSTQRSHLSFANLPELNKNNLQQNSILIFL